MTAATSPPRCASPCATRALCDSRTCGSATAARSWFTLEPVGTDLDVAAATMADLLGWTPERQAAEVAACHTIHHDARRCLDELADGAPTPVA